MADPRLRAKVLWDGVLATTTLIRGFEVRTDKPKGLWGTNTAPAPGELFIGGLGAAVLTTYAQRLRLRKLDVGDLALDVTAPLTVVADDERIESILFKLKVWLPPGVDAATYEQLAEGLLAAVPLLQAISPPTELAVEIRPAT